MAENQKTKEKNKISEIDGQILKNFEIKKRIGKGAYGIVWKAVDKRNNTIVAVKKIFDAFRNETDAQRTFREIMFLRAFREHPHIIKLISVHRAPNNMDIYLSFEYMESDLHNVIKKGSVLKDIHKRYIMYQLLNALNYIHSGNVIHRDLKPSNVLIDSKCRCKIADFGLARSLSRSRISNEKNENTSNPILTDYVATRWYRAPEILVASKRYTKGIDIWSLGCILGEMIYGKPLFPGSSTVNQQLKFGLSLITNKIERITSVLPEATEEEIKAIGASFGSVLLNQHTNKETTENYIKLEELLSGGTEDAKNMVKAMLLLDPSMRLTAKEGLSHKYVTKFRNTISELEINMDIQPPLRDDVQLSISEYRAKLYEIIQSKEKLLNGNISTACTGILQNKNIVSLVSSAKYMTNSKMKEHSPPKKLSERISKAALDKKCIQRDRSFLKYSLESSKPEILPYTSSLPKVVKNLDQISGEPTKDKSDNKNTHEHFIDPYKILSRIPIKRRVLSTFEKQNPIIESKYKDRGTPSDYKKTIESIYTDKNLADVITTKNSKYYEKKFQCLRDINKNEILTSENKKIEDFDNITGEGESYYERRLHILEEKIRKQKRDIDALLCQNSKDTSKTTDFDRKMDITCNKIRQYKITAKQQILTKCKPRTTYEYNSTKNIYRCINQRPVICNKISSNNNLNYRNTSIIS